MTNILIFCIDEIPLDFEFEKKNRKTFQLRGDTHMTSTMRGGEWGKDVQGQGGGKRMDVDGQGLRILEN